MHNVVLDVLEGFCLTHSVAQLALSQGGCKIFEKGNRDKLMKFLIIAYFHVSMAL